MWLQVEQYEGNRCLTITIGTTLWALALDLRNSGLIFNDIEFTSDPDIIYASTDHLKIFKSVDGGAAFFAPDFTFAPTTVKTFILYLTLNLH